MSSASDDDAPAWLTEQASARKEHSTVSRCSSSSDFSRIDDDSDDEPIDGGGGGGKSKGKAGGRAGGKAVGKAGGGDETSAKTKGKSRAPPSHRLPLVLAPKVRRDMLLLETSDTSLDLSGDFGCIGKMHVKRGGGGGGGGGSSQGAGSQPAPGAGTVAELRQTVMVDLKGKVYDADILPCNTLCLLTVDGNKAKVEAVFSDFLQLAAPRDSIFDMQEVQSGELGADFFQGADSDVLSADGSDDEELGPLKEARGGRKMAAGKKKKPAARKKPAGGAKKPAAKKAKAK